MRTISETTLNYTHRTGVCAWAQHAWPTTDSLHPKKCRRKLFGYPIFAHARLSVAVVSSPIFNFQTTDENFVQSETVETRFLIFRSIKSREKWKGLSEAIFTRLFVSSRGCFIIFRANKSFSNRKIFLFNIIESWVLLRDFSVRQIIEPLWSDKCAQSEKWERKRRKLSTFY